MRTMTLAVLSLTLAPLVACTASRSTDPDFDDPSAVDDPSPVDNPPSDPIEISTNGCNEARWCGDLFGTQFASNVDLVPCGVSCSIHQLQSDVEGCLLTVSGPVGIAMEAAYPDAYLAFGRVAVGESVEHVVRVENQGTAACPIADVTVLGASTRFSIVDPGIDVLAPGAFADVAITFAPTSTRGLENALFHVPGAATVWLTLYGVSTDADDIACRLQVDPQHAGGIVLTATTGGGRSTVVTVANAGGGGCLVLPLEVNGDSFKAAPTVSPFDDPLAPEHETTFVAYPSTLPLDVTDGVLAPGEHVALDVGFTAPLAEGTTAGTLVIGAHPNSVISVPLTGIALPPPPLCECTMNWGSGCTFNPSC